MKTYVVKKTAGEYGMVLSERYLEQADRARAAGNESEARSWEARSTEVEGVDPLDLLLALLEARGAVLP